MRARAALDREGIDLTGLATVDGLTGVALILVDAHGENMISVASGANAALTAANVTGALEALAPAEGDVVLVGHEIPTASPRSTRCGSADPPARRPSSTRRRRRASTGRRSASPTS